MTKEDVLKALGDYVMGCKDNYVSKEMAIDPSDVGKNMYDRPIISIGSADDPLWEELKDPQGVGKMFKAPKDWMPEAKTVISYFAPFSEFVRTGNEKDPVDVGNGWLYARIEGQQFLTGVNYFMEDFFKKNGINAFSPYASNDFKYIFGEGTNPDFPAGMSYTSNWSERHVAYVCGLGTFGLSKGLITEKGVSGRFGSFIVDYPFEVDERKYTGLYDYCTMCGKCAQNCPARAISIEKGKEHEPCSKYFDGIRIKYAPRYGCGKCQVNTPCERSIPKREGGVCQN